MASSGPAGLEHWLQVWQVQGQLENGNVGACEPNVHHETFVMFPRRPQIEWSVGEGFHRVMSGDAVHECLEVLLDGAGKMGPAKTKRPPGFKTRRISAQTSPGRARW